MLLRDLVHSADGAVHVREPRRLLVGVLGDLADDAADGVDLRQDLVQGNAGLGHERDALGHLGRRRADELLDLLGGLCRALRQRADFRGDDGEPASCVAGACRFYARIEREQVGLEGDLVDHADDLCDLLRGFLDSRHRLRGLPYDVFRLLRATLRGGNHRIGVGGALGRLLDGRDDFAERRRGLLDGRRVLLGAA